jgi:hypothetical protein
VVVFLKRNAHPGPGVVINRPIIIILYNHDLAADIATSDEVITCHFSLIVLELVI